MLLETLNLENVSTKKNKGFISKIFLQAGTVNRPNFGQCRNFGQNRVRLYDFFCHINELVKSLQLNF